MSSEHQLMILYCKVCGTFHIPPKYLCTKCGNGSLEKYSASGSGRIYTFTTIYVAPELFKNQAPYDIVIIELSEGIKVTARMKKTNEAPLRVGDPVHFFKKDEIGYWFKMV